MYSDDFYYNKDIPVIEQILPKGCFFFVILLELIILIPALLIGIVALTSGELVVGIIILLIAFSLIFGSIKYRNNNKNDLKIVDEILNFGTPIKGRLISCGVIHHDDTKNSCFLFKLDDGSLVKCREYAVSYMEGIPNVVIGGYKQYCGVATIELVYYNGKYYAKENLKKLIKK